MLTSTPISPQPNAVVSKGCNGTFESGQGKSDFSSTFAAVAEQKRNMDDVVDDTNAGQAGWNRNGKPSNDVNPKDQSGSDASEGEKPEEAAKDLEEETESVAPLPVEDDSQQMAAKDFAMGIVVGQTVCSNVETSENPDNETDSSKLPEGSAGTNGQNPAIKRAEETLPLSSTETERSEAAGTEKVLSEVKEPNGIIDTANTPAENLKMVPEEEAKSSSSEAKTSTGENTGGSAVKEVEGRTVITWNAGVPVDETEVKSGNTEAEAGKGKINHLDGLTVEMPSEKKSDSHKGREKADRMLLRNVNSSRAKRSKKDDGFSDGKGIFKALSRSKGSEKNILKQDESKVSKKWGGESSENVGKDSAEMKLVSGHGRKAAILSAQKEGPLNEGMSAKAFSEKSMAATGGFSEKWGGESSENVGKDSAEMKLVSGHGRKAAILSAQKEGPLNEGMSAKAFSEKSMAATGGKVSSLMEGVLISGLRPASESISNDAKTAEQNDGGQKELSTKTSDTSVKVIDIRDAEAQSQKPGSENQDHHSDDKKPQHSQGKEFHGMLEKSEVTKGEDTPVMPKAKYGVDKVTNHVFQETEKEIQKSSGGKENLGSLVRTAAFLLKNGRSEVKIALYPESLGHLKIRISTESHQVAVKIIAETTAAKDLIENNLQQLKIDFQNQGLEIQKFDVSLFQDSNKNGASHNFAFENRGRGKSGTKKDGRTEQDDSLERTVSNFNRAGNNNAVDFFA